jgi:hypothetical protein
MAWRKHKNIFSIFRNTLIKFRSYSLPSACESNENIVVSSSWRIVSSVCVQRFPTISRAKTQLEQQFHDLQVLLIANYSQLLFFIMEKVCTS